MELIFALAAIAGVIALVLVLFAGSRPAAPSINVDPKPLLTRREREALEAIEQAFPECRVFPQVAMGALLQAKKGLSSKQRTRDRNAFGQKIVDFVVEERASERILCIIEVDDRTHNAVKDKARDAMTRSAGYQTLRIPSGARLSPQLIRQARDAANPVRSTMSPA